MQHDANDNHTTRRRDIQEWLAWALALLLASLLCVGLTWSQRDFTLAQEQQRMSEQTRVISRNLVSQLGAVRSVLENVRAILGQRSRDCGPLCHDAAVRALRGAMPGVRALMLVDGQGRVLFSDAGPADRALLGRADFMGDLQRAGSPDTMVLSARVVPGRASIDVRATLPLPADAGMLVAVLDPQYFDVVMRSALYAADMTSAVTDDRGARLLFVPYDGQLPLYDAPGHTAFYERHLRSGQTSTVMQGPLGRQAQLRLVAQRSVDVSALRLDRKLVVSVSRTMEAVRAPWLHAAWEYGLAWAACALAGSIALGLHQRRRRRAGIVLRRQEAERAAAAEQIELALSGANLGVWSWLVEGDSLKVDARGLAMLGYAGGEASLTTRPWIEQIHVDDRRGVQQARARSTAAGSPYEAEYRVRHRSGHWIWLLSRGKVVECDAAGAATRLAGTYMDISARKQAEAEIVRLAFYDGLTSLPNRRLLLDRVGQALAKCERSKTHGALLFLDLDNFKGLNDSLGHQAGDKLLQRVAMRLQDSTRETDTVARLGGDEFVVLLENLGTSAAEAALHAQRVAAKVLHALGLPHTIDGHEIRSTPSVGIAIFGGATHSVDDLLKQADMAMYEAKAAGRNVHRMFDPAMQAVAGHGVVLESELRHALAARQFVLHYQPVLDQDGLMTGAEALVRWQHPRRGLVAPGDFIEQAERSDLIVGIGNWVLDTACRQLTAWSLSEATRDWTIAVNISARQARQPDFVATVLQVLCATGAKPAMLKLELTESMLLGNVDDIVDKMRALKAHGIGFALDDFGTGYSSLSYLERLPLTQLKIDRSFVKDMFESSKAATIVHTIVTLARELGLDVVAEGVETEQQRLALRGYGCMHFQGYLFAAPVPVAGLQRFVALADPVGTA